MATADLGRMHARRLLAVLVGLLSVVAFVGAATTATAGRACLSGVRDGGYSYAGHQAASRGHGVRATITLTREPSVGAGHVAGWVGVGGPGQGAKGGDAWIQVLEVAGRRGWWQVWVDGEPVTERVRMPGSSGRWAPIVTAESWNGGTPTCNAFGFRFERVSISRGGGGSWRRFVSGHRFLDGTHTLRDLADSGPRAATFVAASTD